MYSTVFCTLGDYSPKESAFLIDIYDTFDIFL